ncbi:unnamed protein product, partial [Mesorhabditis spiculigera]
MSGEFDDYQGEGGQEWDGHDDDVKSTYDDYQGDGHQGMPLAPIPEESRVGSDVLSEAHPPKGTDPDGQEFDDFACGEEGLQRLETYEEFEKENVIIENDPRFQQGTRVWAKENSWEPSPINYNNRMPFQQGRPVEKPSFSPETGSALKKVFSPPVASAIQRADELRRMEAAQRTPDKSIVSDEFMHKISTPQAAVPRRALQRSLEDQFGNLSAIPSTPPKTRISPKYSSPTPYAGYEDASLSVTSLRNGINAAALDDLQNVNAVDRMLAQLRLRREQQKNTKNSSPFGKSVTFADRSSGTVLNGERSRVPLREYQQSSSSTSRVLPAESTSATLFTTALEYKPVEEVSVQSYARPTSAATSVSTYGGARYLAIKPGKVYFGFVEPGEQAVRSITITNVGTTQLQFHPTLSSEKNGFSVDKTVRVLNPGDAREVEVRFAPDTSMHRALCRGDLRIIAKQSLQRDLTYKLPVVASPWVSYLKLSALPNRPDLSSRPNGDYVLRANDIDNFSFVAMATGRAASAVLSLHDVEGRPVEALFSPSNRIQISRDRSLTINVRVRNTSHMGSSWSFVSNTFASNNEGPAYVMDIIWTESLGVLRAAAYANEKAVGARVVEGLGDVTEPFYGGDNKKYDVPPEWPLSRGDVDNLKLTLRRTRVHVNSQRLSIRAPHVLELTTNQTIGPQLANDSANSTLFRTLVPDPDSTTMARTFR